MSMPYATDHIAFMEAEMVAYPERISPLTAVDLDLAVTLSEPIQTSDEDIIPMDVTF